MVQLADLVSIEDPAFYSVDNTEVLSRMRSEAPVFFYEPLSCWVLSKYQDIKHASRTPQQYTVTKGILVNDARYGEVVEHSFFDEGAELIATLDPPRHGQVRGAIASAFTPRMIALQEEGIRKTVQSLLDRVDAGESFDFVRDIARVIPTQAVASLLGIPDGSTDVDQLVFWTDQLFNLGAPLSREELAVSAGHVEEMKQFLLGLMEEKRKAPQDDLLSVLVAAEKDNANITSANITMLAELVFIAGIDTTRNLLSGTQFAFARHPEQLARLVADPALVPQAVEEVLRWFTPVPGFMRNAAADIELRGQTIKQGQYIYLLYFAGNRDEDCWTDADAFDITRRPEPGVLSFGFGQHVCIGAALARLETRVFLEELLRRYSTIDFGGAQRRIPSFMQHGWDELQIVYR